MSALDFKATENPSFTCFLTFMLFIRFIVSVTAVGHLFKSFHKPHFATYDNKSACSSTQKSFPLFLLHPMTFFIEKLNYGIFITDFLNFSQGSVGVEIGCVC